MEPRDEEDRRRYTGCGKKKPECESVEKGGTGCFGEAYFPDGRPRLLRYTSGRNLPLLFKETSSSFFFFFSFFFLPRFRYSTSLDIYQTNIRPHISHPLFLFVRPFFYSKKNQGTRIQLVCLPFSFLDTWACLSKGEDVFKQGDG